MRLEGKSAIVTGRHFPHLCQQWPRARRGSETADLFAQLPPLAPLAVMAHIHAGAAALAARQAVGAGADVAKEPREKRLVVLRGDRGGPVRHCVEFEHASIIRHWAGTVFDMNQGRSHAARVVAALVIAVAVAQAAGASDYPAYRSIEMRIGGSSIVLGAETGKRVARAVRDMMGHCGFNTRQHPGNFGSERPSPAKRWSEALDGSHLRVRFAAPFESRSGTGAGLPVTEVLIAFDHADYIGPEFTRHGDKVVEHIRCGDRYALELMCMAELGPHFPASYRRNCKHLEFGADGRPLELPADIAPSCS